MLDMELGTRVDLELMLEGEVDCEWPSHREDSGELGKHHTDTGAQWLLSLVCPCGGGEVKLQVCDGVWTRMSKALHLGEQAAFMDCHGCGKQRTAREIYVSCVRFG